MFNMIKKFSILRHINKKTKKLEVNFKQCLSSDISLLEYASKVLSQHIIFVETLSALLQSTQLRNVTRWGQPREGCSVL